MGGTALRTALWLTLGGWVGSWACFGLVVAPAAFSVLPTSELAGKLVGPVLGTLHLYGLAAGLALAALARVMGRSRILVIAPLILTGMCAFSHFWVSAELAEIRPLAFGPGGSVEIATRYGALHRLSLGIYLVISAATLALVFLHARADTRAAGALATRPETAG
jgi:hypothetical protein